MKITQAILDELTAKAKESPCFGRGGGRSKAGNTEGKVIKTEYQNG